MKVHQGNVYEENIPNSVCIVLHNYEFWKYIWHLCQEIKVYYLCFQFSGRGRGVCDSQ